MKLRVKRLVPFIIILIVFLFIFFPIRFSYTIRVPGQIVPAWEWIVYKSPDGSFVHTLYNHRENVLKRYDVVQLERGDISRFELSPEIFQKKFITKGDTIGRFFSNELERQLARLRGELLVEERSVLLYMTGEKPSLIEEARQYLDYAKRMAEEQDRILSREEELYKQDLISEEQYELTKTTAELYRINVKQAEARLRTVLTGAKQEQIEYTRARVQALKDEIKVLEMRKKDLVFVSPISGKILLSPSPDTILVLVDTSSYVVKMLVEFRDFPYLSVQAPLNFKIPYTNKVIHTYLDQLGAAIRFINGRQFVMASAVVKADDFIPGMIVRCAIKSRPITILDFIKKLFYP